MSDEREEKPTTVMRRDDLLPLVTATSPSVSAHAVPRVILANRERIASSELESLEAEPSPWIVLGVIAVLIAMFIAIVFSA